MVIDGRFQSDASSETSHEFPQNIQDTLVTDEAFQPERSRESRERGAECPSNMYDISVTDETSQSERFKSVREAQSENIPDILVTEEVFQPETLMVANL